LRFSLALTFIPSAIFYPHLAPLAHSTFSKRSATKYTYIFEDFSSVLYIKSSVPTTEKKVCVLQEDRSVTAGYKEKCLC
jgi:hypothetical protein